MFAKRSLYALCAIGYLLCKLRSGARIRSVAEGQAQYGAGLPWRCRHNPCAGLHRHDPKSGFRRECSAAGGMCGLQASISASVRPAAGTA